MVQPDGSPPGGNGGISDTSGFGSCDVEADAGGAGGNFGLIETGGAGLTVGGGGEAGTTVGGGAGGNVGLIETGGAGLTAGGGASHQRVYAQTH